MTDKGQKYFVYQNIRHPWYKMTAPPLPLHSLQFSGKYLYVNWLGFYVSVFMLNFLELNTHWSENVSVMVVKRYKQIAKQLPMHSSLGECS
jgi:hypothetical protein